MKRIGLLFSSFMCFAIIYGQSTYLTEADLFLRNGELDKAKESIDKAMNDQNLKENALTWVYRGDIYLSINKSNNSNYKKLSVNSLDIAFESYVKAIELDMRNEYHDAIFQNLLVVSEAYYNDGVYHYNRGEFSLALPAIENSLQVNKTMSVVDTIAIFYSAITAEILLDYDKAKKYYRMLIAMGYDEPALFMGMGRVCQAQGNDKEAEEYIILGRKKYPDNFDLMISEINFLLLSEKAQKAISLLEEVVKIDNTNPTVFFALGTAYERLLEEQPQNADELSKKIKSSYTSAIGLNPDYFDPYYNLGAFYVNKAAVLINDANAIPLTEEEKYQAIIAHANKYLSEAIPMLEAALRIQPGDPNSMNSLKEIYTRLEMTEKLKEINKHIEKYGQK